MLKVMLSDRKVDWRVWSWGWRECSLC